MNLKRTGLKIIFIFFLYTNDLFSLLRDPVIIDQLVFKGRNDLEEMKFKWKQVYIAYVLPKT